jgi:hypothetical protein
MARRMSYGICEKCGHRTTKGHMGRHIQKCYGEQSESSGKSRLVYYLRIEATYIPDYWIDLEINENAKLKDLDDFLRDLWLECCGHMSQFHMNEYHYVMPYDGSYQIWEFESDMNIALADAFGKEIKEFEYEYDFGSTTELKGKVKDKRKRELSKERIRLLARNEQPKWDCVLCEEEAKHICTYCMYESGGLFCENHILEHECGDEFALPVLNSPRTGVCGYAG